MRSFFDLLLKFSHLLLFVVLEVVALGLLFSFNEKPGAVWLSSSNRVSGTLLSASSSLVEYFGLGKENARLAEENARLKEEIFRLRAEEEREKELALSSDRPGVHVARVVRNSVNRETNWITIDKGSSDSIRNGMAVYNPQGVVGVVMRTGSHYSVVMPLLNGKSSISCQIKGRGNFGFVEWYGGSPYEASLVDLPYLAHVEVGDTVVTNGYSSIFQRDIMVGVVSCVRQEENSPGVAVDVRLAVDFGTLDYVYVDGMANKTME